MAGIDEVLERLVTDTEFRARLAANPVEALTGYMLYDEDLEVLAATLSEDHGASGAVEQRTSKTTLAGLLAAFEGSQAGHFDGKLLRADDLTSEPGNDEAGARISGLRSASAGDNTTSDSGFKIQVATSDLQNAQGLPDGHEDEIEVYGVDYDMTPAADSGESEPDAGEDLQARE